MPPPIGDVYGQGVAPNTLVAYQWNNRHEGGVDRPRAAFSRVTTKKAFSLAKPLGMAKKKKYDGKKDKKTSKTKFKYLLPGEKQ
ncbi:MAG: hypothetical protein U5N85_13740 [Arcicella sp.]|nr:hypothetical protein [Arcicella sp.]